MSKRVVMDDRVREFCRKLAPLMGAALAEMTNRKLALMPAGQKMLQQQGAVQPMWSVAHGKEEVV